jgi:DNA (cytosine-5)-methyltransferase 1
MNPPLAISLFSGCGGDSLGMEQAGFKVMAFNEFNKHATASHLANFPESELIQDSPSKATDITKIPDKAFSKWKAKADLLFAGFPCQGFSKAGKKKAADPRNQLFHQFVRVARLTRPRFIIGENVPGLTTMKSGPNKGDPLMIELILAAFKEIGYEMTYKVLKATDYGIPQARKRLLLVGWDRTWFRPFDTASFWAEVASWGSKQRMPTLASFAKPTLEDAYQLKPNEIPTGFERVAIPIPQDLAPTGKPHPFIVLKAGEQLLSCSKRDSPVHSEVIDLTRPSKTIICTYDHQPRLLVGLRKPNGDSFVRKLLPEELQQIQGFPETFKILGNKKQQTIQIGNAVPPALVESVARALFKQLS